MPKHHKAVLNIYCIPLTLGVIKAKTKFSRVKINIKHSFLPWTDAFPHSRPIRVLWVERLQVLKITFILAVHSENKLP